jgi:hypothetical protein
MQSVHIFEGFIKHKYFYVMDMCCMYSYLYIVYDPLKDRVLNVN